MRRERLGGWRSSVWEVGTPDISGQCVSGYVRGAAALRKAGRLEEADVLSRVRR